MRFIETERIKALSARSNLWGAWLTLHVWAVIIGAGALCVLWPNPLTFVLAVLLIGSRQHGMAILMHEAAHGILFKNRKLNDFVGKWVLAAPYGGDLLLYRKYHLKHHRHTQTDQDPDLPLSAKFPISRASLRRKFWRDISGQTFLRTRLAVRAQNKGKTAEMDGIQAFERGSPWPSLITNGLMFGVLAAMGLWWVYFALWALPLFSWFWVTIRLRNISEHAMTEKSENPLRHARTTKANFLARIFLAPYWVNYHVEHHAYMYVPCYNLPKLHKALLKKGYGSDMEIQPGYGAVLNLATSRA